MGQGRDNGVASKGDLWGAEEKRILEIFGCEQSTKTAESINRVVKVKGNFLNRSRIKCCSGIPVTPNRDRCQRQGDAL